MKPFILILLAGLFTAIQTTGQPLTEILAYEKTELKTIVVKSGKIDSVTRFEKTVIDAFDSKVPFYHIINERQSENKYAILLHGLGGNKMYWIYPSEPWLQYTRNLTAVKDSLIRLGFSLIILDAKYHGERSYELNFGDASYLPPGRSQNVKDAYTFYDMLVSTAKEVRLLMDYAEAFHKDEAVVFYLVGYSMGGGISLLLNAVDERINGVVACVPPMGLPYSDLKDGDWPDDLTEKMKSVSPLYAAARQKSPIALFMGKKDFFIPVAEAEEFYKIVTIADKQIRFYDAGHELPDAFVGDVVSWMSEKIK